MYNNHCIYILLQTVLILQALTVLPPVHKFKTMFWVTRCVPVEEHDTLLHQNFAIILQLCSPKYDCNTIGLIELSNRFFDHALLNDDINACALSVLVETLFWVQ